MVTCAAFTGSGPVFSAAGFQLRGIALSPVLSLVQARPAAPSPSCAASSQHLDSTRPVAPVTPGSALEIDWKVGAEGSLGLWLLAKRGTGSIWSKLSPNQLSGARAYSDAGGLWAGGGTMRWSARARTLRCRSISAAWEMGYPPESLQHCTLTSVWG